MKKKNRVNRREFVTAAAVTAAWAAPSAGRSAAASKAESSEASKRIHSAFGDIDVLVVGGGPAGIGAALGAARRGANTLLVEHYGFFGGVAAWGMGMPINQMRPERTPRSEVHETIISKLEFYGDQAIRMGEHQCWCNVEYLKVAVLDALDEAKCNYLVHTRAVDAVVEDDRVTGVVFATKQGLATVPAKAVVDCTGDADVAFFAGAETMKEIGNLSPQTLCFNLTNVTREQLGKANIRTAAEEARARYSLIPDSWGAGRVAQSHNFYVNHAGTRDLGQFDCTDPIERSRAECLSRRQIVQMTQTMREHAEPVEGIEIIGAGPQIGVRETRRVRGPYVLSEEDALEGRTFDDVIAWRSGFLDIGFVRLSKMKIHDVPYRSILPEKIDGLLTAGRCISATHVAASAGKSMGNCVATGHAAGVAAALSAEKNLRPRQVPVAEIQKVLRDDGVDLKRGGSSQDDLVNKG